jgi:type IV pilus assembly protein PilY1
MNSCKKKSHLIAKSIQFKLLLIVIIGVTTHICYAATIATSPLFLTSSVIPIVMLNISKDHQLYFKAYDDYSDLNNDGSPDTTYDNSINYYGYFDSYKCYSYSDISNRFEPSSTTNTKYCDGLWSGNFLNWASMTRIDTIRKILYGGLRSTDASSTATPSSSTTTTPVTTNPVITNTVTSAYVVSGPVAGNPVTISVIGTISGPNCSLPAPTSTKSAESAPSATTVGTVTNSTPVRGTATNSTPVTDTSGTTTTTTYNTTFISTYTTTQPTTYTTTHTIKVVTTAFRNGDDRNDCDNDNETADIRTTTVTTTYTTTYTSTKTDTKQTSTTSTTTATTLPANALTVLERSYLPNDAHSFAKFYKGSDLKRLTPYTSASGITLCNTTVSNTTLSQNVTDAPLLRVAMGDFSLWSANERWQCRWSQEKTASNGNVPASSGLISALANNPSNASSGSGDFNVRVKVCVNGLINTENCKTYPDGTLKPIGLLQTYGDGDLIRFGLLTGSYGKNKSGGVLRKNVSSITDEINVTTNGTFKSTPSTGGVLNTLNKLRIHGYRHDDGTYFGTTGSDNCTWGLNIFIDGNCSNWGNPQSEIFLESLRYLSNHSALTAFLPASPKTDSSYISGLTVATRNNPPISATEWCAKLNVIQFNASTSSYDHDQLGSVSDISSTAMNALTNVVGVVEGIPGTSRFVGENGTDINQLCTAKTVNNLSDVRGTCPDAPRLSGTYHVAGLAQFAHNNDIQLGLQGDQLVTTYGVALSPHVPKIVVPVPGSPTKTVTILPACQNSSVGGNCTIVDFKIVHQECNQLSPIPADSNSNCGKIYVNWEDSEQGGDFDQDEWGILTYSVNSTQVKITTKVIAQSTPYKMGFGYILSGTKKDGFHAHSGIYGYAYTDPQGTTACNNCVLSNAASSETYEIGNGSALSLQQPLFYAAKWGGFIDSNSNGIPDLLSEWDSDGNNIPDNYFYATDPSQLAKALNAAFANVVATSASASAVAANSTRLDSGTQVYQAKFNSTDWSGQLQAYNVNTSNGALSINWEASALIPNSRNIRTYNPSAAAGTRGVDFQWPNLTTPTPNPLGTSQQEYLNAGDSYGALRVDWLRGNKATEKKNGGYFRDRTNLLGDIVNSDPVYVGSEDYGYSSIDSGWLYVK